MIRARISFYLAFAAALLAARAPATPPGTAASVADAPFHNLDSGQIATTDTQLRRAPARPKPAPAANPLWAVPLSALSETRKRPLFSPSRRPPPIVTTVRHRPPDRLPPRPVPPARPPLKLVGTIVGDAKGFGLFVDTSSKTTVRLATGSAYRGWVLRTVRERTVVMEKNHLNQTLSLPTPGHAQAAAKAHPPAPRAHPSVRHDPVDGSTVYH